MTIRPTQLKDIAGLKIVLDETELFPSDMLEEMLHGFLLDEDCPDIWLTAEIGGEVVGFCYAVPEQLTEGTWNMLAIAIHPGKQGAGIGKDLTKHLEAMLAESGQRILIVDTSGTDSFAATRRFYSNNGYAEEARIRDFWSDGDDKVIFRKAL